MDTSKPAAKVTTSKKAARAYRAIHVRPTANKGFIASHHYSDGTSEPHAFTSADDLHAHLSTHLKKWKGKSR